MELRKSYTARWNIANPDVLSYDAFSVQRKCRWKRFRFFGVISHHISVGGIFGDNKVQRAVRAQRRYTVDDLWTLQLI